MSDLDEIVREFLVESYEGLDRLDRDLVALEQRPRDQELLAAIFRCIHTIKGTCGFLGFSKLESVSHVGESLLSLLRDGTLELTPAITSALLQLVDAVRQMLAAIEVTQTEGEGDYSEVVELLTRLQRTERTEKTESTARDNGHGRCAPSPSSPSSPSFPSSEASDRSIRVDVGLLDRLMNLVGELVLARNQILQVCAGDRGLGAARHLPAARSALRPSSRKV